MSLHGSRSRERPNRQSINDVVNTTLEAGQRPGENHFGMTRRIADAQTSLADQLQQLEAEKISLMKRLNMVLSELEKATHEKSDIGGRLRQQETLAEELKKKLDEVASLKNVVNRNLQDDLHYERDLNSKLREELDRFESEKETLLSKLREEEDLSNQIQNETELVNSNLLRKADDLKRLESEHNATNDRLRQLNDQLDRLRNQEVKNRAQKVSMDEQLADLTNQRNDLIKRMNELSDKYENYVQSMNRERVDIQQSNKQHVKVLVAKLLHQIMDENLRRKKKIAFQEITGTARQMSNLESKATKLFRVLGNYIEDRKRTGLRTWYRKALNVVHENYKRNSLIDRNVEHNNKQKFFFLWRQVYLNRKRIFANKIACAKIVQRLTAGNQDVVMRNYLCRWRDFTERRAAQEDFLKAIAFRRCHRMKRKSFIKWLASIKQQDMQERQDILADMVTETTYKQRVFLAFKHAVQQSKAEMAEYKFRAWKNWCEAQRKKKFFEKKEIMVGNIEGLRTERLLKRCFDAIKFFNTQHKFETTRAQLESKIPEKEELEYKKECLEKQAATKTKYHAMRQCYLRHCDVQYRALMIWKDACTHHSQAMKRMKIRLINEHKRRLNWAFQKMKEKADTQVHMTMMMETEDIMNSNQNLTNEISVKKKVKEKQAVQSGNMKKFKLERIRNMLARKDMRELFDKWKKGALQIQGLDEACAKLKKTEHKRRMRIWFARLRNQAKQTKRGQNITARCDWLTLTRNNANLKDIWLAWKHHLKVTKLAKKFMDRALNGQKRNFERDAFMKWKQSIAKQVQMTHMADIEQINSNIETQQMDIKRNEKEIQACKSGRMHIKQKAKNLSSKVMANYLVRAMNADLQRGFYTWLENTRSKNQTRRDLRKALLYWQKNKLAAAFRKWTDNHYAGKKEELTQEIDKRHNERLALKMSGEEGSRAQEEEVMSLKADLREKTKDRNQMKVNLDNALTAFRRRKEGNVYIDKREHIFTEWALYIKKEKAAVNVIGSIARLTLRREVFQRIRLAARENFLDNMAEKIAHKFFDGFKSGLLKKAWLRWRENAKKHVLTDLMTAEMQMESSAQAQTEQLNVIAARKHKRADQCIKNSRLRKANTAMIEMLKILKALRAKSEVLKANVKYMRSKRAMQKWFGRTQVTLYLRRRNEQTINNYRLMKLRHLWNAWHKNIEDEKKGGKLMSKILNRMQYFDQSKAFQHWQQFIVSAKERDGENKTFGSSNIGAVLNRIVKRRLAIYMHQLKIRTERRDFKQKFLTRMLRHVADYRKRHYFYKWKHCSKCESIAEKVNKEGDVVMRRNELARQAAAMKKKLIELGYSPEAIDKYLDEKSAKQRENMQKGIIALFFRNSEGFDVVPKAFNQLKAYVRMRKQWKEKARKIVNMMRHPLAIYFNKWKFDMADNMKKLEGISKQELIDKIIADENLIGSTESRLDRMGNTIDNLAFQRENLFGHFVRGQKLAVALMKNNHMKSMYRAFLRWKRFNQAQGSQALLEQLGSTKGMIGALKDHVAKLENINRNLLAENEELRQAALDGIEISNVVQELTKERESLSADLQDRGGTIKRLIEDNNNLSIRLNIAQQEAQQLEAINQQVYSGAPQRD